MLIVRQHVVLTDCCQLSTSSRQLSALTGAVISRYNDWLHDSVCWGFFFCSGRADSHYVLYFLCCPGGLSCISCGCPLSSCSFHTYSAGKERKKKKKHSSEKGMKVLLLDEAPLVQEYPRILDFNEHISPLISSF